MMNLKKLSTIIFLFVTQFIIVPMVSAGSIKTDALNSQDDHLMANSGLAGNSSLSSIISVLIQTALGFLGVIFLVLTIMAGFKWMMSEGNEEEIKKAQGSLKNAVIGLVIVLAAYAITYSVFKYLPFAGGGLSGGTSGGPPLK